MIQLSTFIASVTLAVALAFLNNYAWGRKWIGDAWHVTQWIALALFALGFVSLTGEYLFAVVVWSAIHWIVFEGVLYSLRKLPLMYVGETAFSDRLFRTLGELIWSPSNGGSSYAMAKVVKVAFKAWYLLLSMAVYSFICEC